MTLRKKNPYCRRSLRDTTMETTNWLLVAILFVLVLALLFGWGWAIK